jgi:lipid-A-disaccharide synthase
VASARSRLLIIAGEVSGDHQGALLGRALRGRRPTLTIAGVGGPEMAAAGIDVLMESLRWGVIGYVEAYVRLPVFALRFWALVRLVERYRPDLLVLVDFPGMNRELVRHFSGRLPMVYFVPPQTVFRRGASAARMARATVRLLAVLPFEADAYRRAGADVVFIGHPAVDAVAAATTPPERLRGEWALPPGPVIGLLPGSRVQEVRRLLPSMLAAARDVCAARGASCLLPLASPFLRADVQRAVAATRAPVRLIEGRALDVMRAADLIVVASGTASLEAACVGVPMVVVYRLSRLTDWIGRRFVVTPDFYNVGFSLPNIVMGRRVVPELLNEEASGPRIRAEVERLLGDSTPRARMCADLAEVKRRLGLPGAVDRAAEETLRVLDSPRQVTLR